jgi:hypothetical protein
MAARATCVALDCLSPLRSGRIISLAKRAILQARLGGCAWLFPNYSRAEILPYDQLQKK